MGSAGLYTGDAQFVSFDQFTLGCTSGTTGASVWIGFGLGFDQASLTAHRACHNLDFSSPPRITTPQPDELPDVAELKDDLCPGFSEPAE